MMERKSAAFECKFSSGPEGTFEGYASVFGNEDDNGDLVKPTAFDGTLAQHKARGTMPKMLLNHGGLAWETPTPLGLIPIGKWIAMTPDTAGLHTKGRLINLDTEFGRRIYGAMKERELNGLSIGFKAREFTRGMKPNGPRRILSAVDLFEVSIVTFPANRLALIADVKGSEINRTTHDGLSDAGAFHSLADYIRSLTSDLGIVI